MHLSIPALESNQVVCCVQKNLELSSSFELKLLFRAWFTEQRKELQVSVTDAIRGGELELELLLWCAVTMPVEKRSDMIFGCQVKSS